MPRTEPKTAAQIAGLKIIASATTGAARHNARLKNIPLLSHQKQRLLSGTGRRRTLEEKREVGCETGTRSRPGVKLSESSDGADGYGRGRDHWPRVSRDARRHTAALRAFHTGRPEGSSVRLCGGVLPATRAVAVTAALC